MGGDRSASPAVFRYEGWALESTPRGRAAPMEGKKVSRPECTRTRRCPGGKPLATYPANLCPLRCGGAMSHSGPRTTILHSEGGHCKRFLRHPNHQLHEP